MPHSPYTQTVAPPVYDLELYEARLRSARVKFVEHELEYYDTEDFLVMAEDLLEHCQFLDTKLVIKKQNIAKLEQSLQSTKAELKKVQEQLNQSRAELQSLKDAHQLCIPNTAPQSPTVEPKPQSTLVVSPPQQDRSDTSKPGMPTAGTLSRSHDTVESVIPQKRMREAS